MSYVSIYLDTRRLSPSGEGRFRLLVSHHGSNAMLSLGAGCKPSEWDGNRVTRRPDRSFLNMMLQEKLHVSRNVILSASADGSLSRMTAAQLRDRIADVLDPKFKEQGMLEPYILEVTGRKSEATGRNYTSMLVNLRKYDRNLKEKTFESIDRKYLNGFIDFLSKTVKPNTVDLYMRVLTSVYNSAIDDGLTTHYPFRGVHCRREPTAKRNLSVEQMRAIASLELSDRMSFPRDMFLLSFMLIGMNTKDMYLAKPMTSTGRIDYIRAKTGKRYSIKVHRRAFAIMDRYSSRDRMIDVKCASLDAFRASLKKALHRIGAMIGVPGLSMYYARHTWASVASELDISHDTIARALGHGGNTVTDVYIAYDYRKVDEANRLVIEHAFGH